MKISHLVAVLSLGLFVNSFSSFASSPIPLEVISEFHLASHELTHVAQTSKIELPTQGEVQDFMIASDSFVSCLNDFSTGHRWFFDDALCDREKDDVLASWMKIEHPLYSMNIFFHPLLKFNFNRTRRALHELFKYYGQSEFLNQQVE